ncbi:tetratricopeptide repeat protein [Streptomyces sp. NPDC088124]|uniref:tetratricopeptide repeat protein n=1 Tax=Streptomyces sp. NPDC088124 TaxID=3154654 RepID=UPI00342FD124
MGPNLGIGRRQAQQAVAAAWLAWDEGELDLAEQHFDRALRKLRRTADRDPEAAETAAEAHTGMGRICLARENFRAADPWFHEARRLAPSAADGFYWGGCGAAHQADFERAEWLFGRALECGGQRGRTHAQRAYVRIRQGRPDLALVDLYAADQHDALDDRGLLLAACLLLRQGRPEQAEMFAARVEPAARTPRTAAVLGFALQEQNKLPAAYDAYARALAGGYADDEVLLQYCLTAYRLRRFDTYLDSWTELRARHPDDPRFAAPLAAAHWTYARELTARRDFAEAIEHLEAARRTGVPVPPDALVAELHLHAAARAIARGDLDGAARAHLTASRRLRPGDPRPAHYLAVLAAAAGRLDEAADLWRRIDGAGPDGAEPDDGGPGGSKSARTGPVRPEPARVRAGRVRAGRVRLGLALCAAGSGPAEDAAEELGGCLVADPAWADVVRQARYALAALRFRDGGWPGVLEALAPAPGHGEWDGLHAEGLYRAGRFDELLALPARGARRPWQAMARLRTRPPDGGPPDEAEIAAAVASDRTRPELAPLLRDIAYGHAERAEWERAASWLAHADEAAPDDRTPTLIEALVHGLGGDRVTAVDRLERATAHDPADHRTGHVRALMLLHTISADVRPRGGRADWGTCVGTWMSVLHDDAFWARWRERAERRYGEPVAPGMLETLRADVQELIERRIVADRSGTAATTALLLRREERAARALRDHGGLPLPGATETNSGENAAGDSGGNAAGDSGGNAAGDSGGNAAGTGARLVCGPLRLAELGLERHFGAFTEALTTADTDIEDLYFHFTQLGLARVQLTAGRLDEALELALDTRCARCRAADEERRTAAERRYVTRPVRATDEPRICRPDCAMFDQLNPALAGLPTGREDLLRGSAVLAVEALLDKAMRALSAREPDGAEVARSWQRAVRYADRVDQSGPVRRTVVDAALGRADVLHRKKKGDDAITVLDAALSAVGGRDPAQRERVVTHLSQALTTRAILTVNEDSSRTAPARADLVRAVELNPRSVRARLNLGIVLRIAAFEALDAGDISVLVELLTKAVEQFDLALLDRPDDPRILEERTAASQSLNQVFAGLRSAPDRSAPNRQRR